MNKWIIAMAATALVGCESAVLVNNRPPTGTDVNAGDQSQQASATIDADRTQESGATTRPAEQTVETKNTRIESQ